MYVQGCAPILNQMKDQESIRVLAVDGMQCPLEVEEKEGLLSQIFDGKLYRQRNGKVPTKANHGARPCSHWSRYIKVEEKWYGPRWYRKKLKKMYRNSENKIHP